MMDRSRLPFFEGQRLDRAEFHRLYEMTPEDFRAELIGGVVYFKGRVGIHHAVINAAIVGLLGLYEMRTPGLRGGVHPSTILDDRSEVHPDAVLLIRPEFGGQTYPFGEYLGGAPELVVEVADESRAIDLGPKLADYERAGVLEYVVLALDPCEVFWHARRHGRLVRLRPDPDGLHRSATFPGLHLDAAALFADDLPASVAALERGLATPEHADFVARLAAGQP